MKCNLPTHNSATAHHAVCIISFLWPWTSTKLCFLPHSTSSSFTVLFWPHGGKKKKEKWSIATLTSTQWRFLKQALHPTLQPYLLSQVWPWVWGTGTWQLCWLYNGLWARDLLRVSCLGFVMAQHDNFLSSGLARLASICFHSLVLGTTFICCDSYGRCQRNHKCQTKMLQAISTF